MEKSDESRKKIFIMDKNINRIMEDRVILKRIPKSKHNWLIIMRDNNDEEIPYYSIRTQERSINTRIKQLQENNNDTTEILRIRHPNSVLFWEDIKTKYSNNFNITDGNWFSLLNMSENKFIKKIK